MSTAYPAIAYGALTFDAPEASFLSLRRCPLFGASAGCRPIAGMPCYPCCVRPRLQCLGAVHEGPSQEVPVLRTIGWVLLAASAIARPASAEAEFRVRTDREVYRFAEPIWFYVEIRNVGDTELAVENPQCSRTHTRIEITDPAGTVLPMTGPASCATTILETIPADQSMLYAFELLEFYGADGPGAMPFGILPVGTYSVRYRTGDAASDGVSFVVEDLDARDVGPFHAYLDLLSQTRPTDLPGAAARFRAFAEAHPESPFAAALLCRAGVLSDLFFDSDQAMNDFRRLITLFPESGFVSIAVRHLAFGMGPERGHAAGFLRTVSEDLPGTLAADFAARVSGRLATRGIGG